MSQGGPGKKVANRLVVLSSGAVLAVYAAGYVRTQAAADQLEDKLTRRRPPAQPAAEGIAAPVERESSVSRPGAPTPRETPERASVVAAVPNATPAPETPVVLSVSATMAPPAVNQVPTQVTAQTPAAAAVVEQKVEQKVEPKVEPKLEQKAEAAPAPVAEPPAQAPKSKWHDGKWSGWGTSRHGDIEATVVIEGGRILSAVISQCYTRYPCDYIDHLPPQVAQRQSADVDTVSRATESADAFYFAVSSALAESQKGK